MCVLKPVNKATTSACFHILEVIPLLHFVHAVLQKELACEDKSATFGKKLQLSIKARFPKYKTTPPYVLATALDLGFKDTGT